MPLIRILLSLLTIMIFSVISSAQTTVCSGCGKPILEGSYVIVDGKNFHPEHFLCTICDKPINTREYFEEGGKYYDKEHYLLNVAPRCAHCGKPLENNHIIYEGKKYHDYCYEENIALKCDLCRKSIEGNYITTFWATYYHKYHSNDEMQCTYCSRFISDGHTNGGYTYQDGRYICGLCKPLAVDEMTKGKYLLSKTKNDLKKLGVDIDWDGIGLHLVDKLELKRRSQSRKLGENQTGFMHYQYETLNGSIIKREFDIYILHGMPEMQYITTAAHELMHVWLILNSPTGMDKALNEGSCNYASMMILDNYHDDWAKFMLQNLEEDSDPYYGEGFRRVKKLVKTNGKKNWLNYLTSNTRFPRGY